MSGNAEGGDSTVDESLRDESKSDDPNYCETHDVDIDSLPDRDHCPYCRMERDREAEMMERATRHAPRSVDDPASTASYNAW